MDPIAVATGLLTAVAGVIGAWGTYKIAVRNAAAAARKVEADREASFDARFDKRMEGQFTRLDAEAERQRAEIERQRLEIRRLDEAGRECERRMIVAERECQNRTFALEARIRQLENLRGRPWQKPQQPENES